MILRAISERGGIVGQIISSLLGFAWGVVTFLVVPILVVENVGPVEAVKRSGSLLKKTWGEQLVGNFSIGSIFGLLIFAAILIGGFLTFALAAALNSPALMVLMIVVTILVVLGLSLLSSTLSGIFQAALYRELLAPLSPGIPTHLVTLLPSLDVALQRDAPRGPNSIPDRVRAVFDEITVAVTEGELPGAILDTSRDANAAVTADRVQDLVARGESLLTTRPWV